MHVKLPQSHVRKVNSFWRKFGMKLCNRCGRTKDYSEFYNASGRADGKMGVCINCLREVEKRPGYKEYVSERWLVRQYQLTRQDWEALFDSQGRRCAICRTDDPGNHKGSGWVVDHDHRCCPRSKTCGRCVRAILCNVCNVTVGYIENHPDLAAVLGYVASFTSSQKCD